MTSALLPVDEFVSLFRQFRYSVFRLETLQEYRAPDEDAVLEAFRAGRHPPPPDPDKEAWLAVVRAAVREHRITQRVHLVTEPLSDYLLYELTWGYAPNVAAGEDIRIVALAAGDTWPADIGHQDFWLFDASQLYVMEYDQLGSWRGVRHVNEPADVITACRSREAALHHGVPWLDYVDRRPELARHLKQGLRPTF